MKTITAITSFVMTLLVVSGISMAQVSPTPCPFAVDLNGPNVVGVDITMYDEGKVIQTQTTVSDGSVIFELGGTEHQCSGKEIRIVGCDDCIRTVIPNTINTWNFPDGIEFTTPPVEVIEVEIPAGLPDSEVAAITAIITAIVSGGAVAIYTKQKRIKLTVKDMETLANSMPRGAYVKVGKSYSGKTTVKHWHRSPKSYHDLEDRHKEPYDHEGSEKLFPDILYKEE